MSLTITPTIARRLAITRQRLAGPMPDPTPAGIMDVVRDLGCLQLDPIRAVEKTQYLVLWSRLGHYDVEHLHTLLWERRDLFEYWAHAASIVLTEDYPLHQPNMLTSRVEDNDWTKRVANWLRENHEFYQYVHDALKTQGPLFGTQLEDRSVTPWKSEGWNEGRNLGQLLNFLWTQGEVMVAGRKGNQRQWALAEQWLPQWINQPPLPEAEVVRIACQKSLRALGVATAKQIKIHFIRNRYPNLKQILADLVSEQTIMPVTIADETTIYSDEWYIHANDLPLLERLQHGEWYPRTTLLSPFDNLICNRDRTELLWNFYFRIEIYVPKVKRQYGYYVLPILHGDQLIGRIDPKMDRKTSTFRINAIYLEPSWSPTSAGRQAITDQINALGQFLGAKTVILPEGWDKAEGTVRGI
ncbi:crosslink repair DNA glycosylase YcaQ family protein [Anaerolineales bacterium HSG6]|nr:crosslink repair DNA glycosylase YcaQ family protein [Anaerolineales bacterium HSG6]